MLRRLPFWLAVALVCVWLAAPAPAGGATITVNNPVTGTGGTGDCTLAEAIQAANTDTAVDGCPAGSGADIIKFCNCTLSLAAADHTDPTDGPIGLPDITSDIIIQGIQFDVSILERLPAAPDFALFRVTGTGRLVSCEMNLKPET